MTPDLLEEARAIARGEMRKLPTIDHLIAFDLAYTRLETELVRMQCANGSLQRTIDMCAKGYQEDMDARDHWFTEQEYKDAQAEKHRAAREEIV